MYYGFSAFDTRIWKTVAGNLGYIIDGITRGPAESLPHLHQHHDAATDGQRAALASPLMSVAAEEGALIQ